LRPCRRRPYFRTLLHSFQDRKIRFFHCQSYQNYKGAASFEECATTQIDGRADLFKNYIEEECIFLGGTWSEASPHGPSHLVYPPNFGHFIFEYLNRIAIFAHYGLTQRLPIVVYDRVPERWLGFLELADIPRDRIIRIPLVNPPAFRKVWVSSACHYRDTAGAYRVWGAGVHWLRSLMLGGIGGTSASKRRRIYIGRDNAKWRKIANEDAVRELLDSYGFEYPAMSELSAREQLEVMSSAEIVICALGAGTIMIQFAPEHCITILLAPIGVGQGLWGGSGSAVVLRQIFERLDCEHVTAPDLVRLDIKGMNEVADFVVDIELLKAKIEDALYVIAVSQSRTPCSSNSLFSRCGSGHKSECETSSGRFFPHLQTLSALTSLQLYTGRQWAWGAIRDGRKPAGK